MANLRQTAFEYVAPETKNIADLEKVSVDIDVVTKEFTKTDGEKFSLDVVTIDGEDYRVPKQVIKNLKVILEDRPDLEFFKVKKSGEGMSTSYTVIPL